MNLMQKMFMNTLSKYGRVLIIRYIWDHGTVELLKKLDILT